jgi:transcriptional regulator with XRE-family HTH domain
MDSDQKIKKLFGARVKSIRETRNLTQEKLAEKVDMNPVYLSNIERGRENPTFNLLIKLSVGLDVDLGELFDFKHEVNSKALRELLKKYANECDDDEKLKTAVRVVRDILR